MPAVQTSTDDVFINCPFDDAFAPTFRALIFAILVCGFRPRSARELDDGGQTRIDKIFALIEQCRYGIHDLSRTELDAAGEFDHVVINDTVASATAELERLMGLGS